MSNGVMAKRFALALSVYAEIEGMKAANSERDTPRESVAYEARHFEEKAEELKCISSMHDDQF